MKIAFQGVDTACFMVHVLPETIGFEAKELEAAHNFASMARGAGVRRFINLGANGNESDGLSPTWSTGNALRETGIHDLLDYLVQALDIHLEHDEIVKIGGRDRMSKGDLLRAYAGGGGCGG
jgi:uncharacterized protein YbjT (DUF2867 family)